MYVAATSDDDNKADGLFQQPAIEVKMTKITADKILDARGLCCPMPSVKTALTLEAMGSGEVLLVLTDDPVSKKDLPIWAESTGNTLLGLTEEGRTISIYLRKG